MNRAESIASLVHAQRPFDIVVIGGGANGAGIALDAATRGLAVALFERSDFGSGTSSRSSKLIHGGIRYLGLGQFGLVYEALRERALLLRNAGAVVKRLPFLIPAASRIELIKFTAGLMLYDRLAGARSLQASRRVSMDEARRRAPGLSPRQLVGAVCYEDAQFDDVRLLLAILHRAAARGATLLNYAAVTALQKDASGAVRGVVAVDATNGVSYEVAAHSVINATGIDGDRLRHLDDDGFAAAVLPSQGAHIVVPRRFLGGEHALVLPRTPDGRIMFAIPWQEHVLLGTTDTPLAKVEAEPLPQAGEIDAILGVAARFLEPAPVRADILSTFAGVRPLAATPGKSGTARVSREHAIHISPSGLVSVSGGKWTTYRMVAEQCVDAAVRQSRLRAGCSVTRDLDIAAESCPGSTSFATYGPACVELERLVAERPELGIPLHPELPYCGAHFVWAARAEMAINVADALAFRTRASFINAAAAAAIAPRVADLMAAELAWDAAARDAQIEAARAAVSRFSLTPIPARAAPD